MNQARRERELALFQKGPEAWLHRLGLHAIRITDDPLGIHYEAGLPTSVRDARQFIVRVFGQHRRTLPLVLQGFSREISSPEYGVKPCMSSVQAAALASLWKDRKMPVKRTAKGGIGKAARAKKKNYGASASFNKALVAAVERVENRTLETTYSQSGAFLNVGSSTFNQTGFNLSGLNQTAAYSASTPSTRISATNQCFVFPICPLAQVGNSSTPGYRKGQRINPLAFRFSIEHNQSLSTVAATYKWAVVRNTGSTLTTNNTTPGIVQTNGLNLFVPLTQGPLAASGGPNGALPLGDFSSCMRWNRAEWAVKKSGSYVLGAALERLNSNAPTTPTVPPYHNTSKCFSAYTSFKEKHWDYPLPTAISNIKGGDYYFIMWREGIADTFIGNDVINFVCELSFKDP